MGGWPQCKLDNLDRGGAAQLSLYSAPVAPVEPVQWIHVDTKLGEQVAHHGTRGLLSVDLNLCGLGSLKPFENLITKR